MMHSLAWINDVEEAKPGILSYRIFPRLDDEKNKDAGDDSIPVSGSAGRVEKLHITTWTAIGAGLASSKDFKGGSADINSLEDAVKCLTLCRGNFRVLE